jgi:hypothetical protein
MSEEKPGSYSESAGEHRSVVTPHALVIPLTEEHRRQARECLDRSGSITFKVKEISVTRLPDTLLHNGDGGVIID